MPDADSSAISTCIPSSCTNTQLDDAPDDSSSCSKESVYLWQSPIRSKRRVLCQSDIVFINDESLQRAEAETSKKRQCLHQKINNESIEDVVECTSNINLISSTSSIADNAVEPEENDGDDTDYDEEEDDDDEDESEFETELQDIIIRIDLLRDCIKSYKDERILIDIEQHKKFHAYLISSIISNSRDSCKTERPLTTIKDGVHEAKPTQPCRINNEDYFLSFLSDPSRQEKTNSLNQLLLLTGYPVSTEDSSGNNTHI